MKRLLLIIALAGIALGTTACNNGDDQAVVETNAGDVTKEELYEELKAQYGDQVIQQLVQKKLLEKNYDVSDKEVEEEFEKSKEQFGSDEEFEMALQQSGFADADAYKEAIRYSLLMQKAATEGIEVTDEKLKTFYEENKDLFVEVDASHILVDNEATAKEVKQKLGNGEKFEDLVQEYYTDTASVEKDGSVGKVTTQSQFVPEFIDATLQLEEGEISEPIQSSYGYHIIKANERTVKTLEDNREEIEEMYLQHNAKSTSEVMNELFKNGDIKVNDDQFKDLFKVEETNDSEDEASDNSNDEDSQ